MVHTVRQHSSGGVSIEDGSEPILLAKGSPTSGSIEVKEQRYGAFVRLDFTLTRARITVTDGAAAGSYGSLKLCDLAQYAALFLGARQDYTSFVEGASLTTGAGDAVFKLGVGTAAIAAAADAALTGTQVNIGSATANITNVAGTGAGTAVNAASAALDGTTTPLSLYLNWSGTAASIDANSTIDVTGTISIIFAHMGDD